MLIKCLKPLKRKMILKQCFNYAAFGLLIGVLISGLILIASKFILIENMAFLIFIANVAAVGLGVLIAIIKSPSYYEVAKASDSLGYKERFTTALELSKNTDAVSKLVIEDALQKAKENDISKQYKIGFPKKTFYLICAFAILAVVVGFIPSPVAKELTQQKLVKNKVEEEVVKIEKVQKKINEDITAKDAKELDAKVKELTKDLKKAKTEAEAIKQIQKAQSELKKLANNTVSKDLKKLGEKLTQNEKTKALGESLQKGDVEQIEKELKELNDFLENASEEELKELADFLKEAAKEIAENMDLAENISEFSSQLASGSLGDKASKSFQTASNKISQIASQNSEFRDAIEQYNKAFSESSKSLQGKSSQSSQKGQTAPKGEGQGEESEGEGEGEGSGSGSGSGNGNGGGQGSNGNGGNASGSPGSGRGTGHIANENIYSRKAQNYGDYETQVKGTQNEGGSLDEQEQKGIGSVGEVVSYDKVIGEYKDEALKSLEDYEIPGGMKSLVREYFSTLE